MAQESGKSSHFAFWGVIIAAVITGAVALYIHFDSEQGLSEKIGLADSEKQGKKQEHKDKIISVKVQNMYLPPINTTMDSFFFLEIKNNSTEVAEAFTVTADFGKASPSACEILPQQITKMLSKESLSSILKYTITRLEVGESLYLYCHLSQPTFRKILITSGNLSRDSVYTFDDYTKVKTQGNVSGWRVFFNIILGLVFIVFVFFFLFYALAILDKKLGKYVENLK